MAERPLLLLPKTTPATRGRKGGGGGGPSKLSAERQEQRLGLRLKELDAAFEQRRVLLQMGPEGAIPEDVLVLETAGTVDEFVKAVSRIDGFEFLAEYDEEDIPPDEDFFVAKDDQRLGYTGRVYMVFASQQAFQQLLRLWKLWQNGDPFERGYAKWRDVFSLLRDIGPWGVKDRLEETGVLADWNERVRFGQEHVPCEIELWFRTNDVHRREASLRIRKQIDDLGGKVLAEGIIAGIHYHGIAARLPIETVKQLLDTKRRNDVRLVQSEQIQFIRAAGQMAIRSSGERKPTQIKFAGPDPKGDPVVALLDGLPLQQHRALAGRIRVDDPDGYETNYRADARVHGTAMSSLIVWGDLNATERVPIPQPLYVRPIMQAAFPPEWTKMAPFEQVPDDALVVDLIHRSVRRLFNGDGSTGAVAPSVAVVNFSIGIRDRPFASTLSPLARLLDWLSWEYGVLFIVSAGNHLGALEVNVPWSELEGREPAELAGAVIRALAADTRNRRVLSPAEAMNVITVAGLHSDLDTALPHTGTRIDPLLYGMPSPFNGQGLGYRRSIKPDVLMPAGRIQFVRPVAPENIQFDPVLVPAAPGHEVATPGAVPGDVTHTMKNRGTSNAAAMLSRAAAFLAPVVTDLREQDGGLALANVPTGLLLKALLAHGARWGSLGENLRSMFETKQNSDQLPEQLARLIGFGPVELLSIGECSALRVTAVGGGTIEVDGGVEHRLPLPPSLSGKRGWRRLTVTLAWFTPISPLSHRWRRAAVWFETPKSKLKLNRVGPDWQAAQRGTLQHDTFEGQAAAAFVDGDDVVVRVSCREDAPGLDVRVPYAIAVTLEVAEALGIDIYAEVRTLIRTRERIAL